MEALVPVYGYKAVIGPWLLEEGLANSQQQGLLIATRIQPQLHNLRGLYLPSV